MRFRMANSHSERRMERSGELKTAEMSSGMSLKRVRGSALVLKTNNCADKDFIKSRICDKFSMVIDLLSGWCGNYKIAQVYHLLY